MYNAVLIAELVALAVLAVTVGVWRLQRAPSGEARRIERRHRERRDF